MKSLGIYYEPRSLGRIEINKSDFVIETITEYLSGKVVLEIRNIESKQLEKITYYKPEYDTYDTGITK